MDLSHPQLVLTRDVQIQPDMITLDPEFVGSMAPPTKLTTDINGKSDIPFARLPRQQRLKLQGRADETEEASEGRERGGEAGKVSREEEKKRTRGKNKAMKRYLRKQRKNVVDPKAVRISSLHPSFPHSLLSPKVALREKLQKEREQRKKARDATKGLQEDRLPSALDRFRT